jgi:hypothetical protein
MPSNAFTLVSDCSFGNWIKSEKTMVFGIFNSPQKRHRWAERLTGLSRDNALDGAQSKDLEGAYRTHAARSFSTAEARTWRTRHGLFLGREQELLASCYVRTTNPDSKYLAQSWGWKMIKVHEEIYPVTIKSVPQQILFSASVVEKLRAAWAK